MKMAKLIMPFSTNRMKKPNLIAIVSLAVLVVAGALFYKYSTNVTNRYASLFPEQVASPARAVTSPFIYNFTVDGTLAETGAMDESSSPYWWLNSGGRMYLKSGIGMTIQGELPTSDKWRVLYNIDNPADTDLGFHPQNIFRLVTRSKWKSFSQQTSFQIVKNTLSASEERDAWSGILLFNRYQDGNNLYYTGIRDDGHAVIKSKKKGDYVTLAEKSYFPGTYDRAANPSLLPVGKWMAIKSEITTNSDNTVSIKLYVDNDNSGKWTLALEAKDTKNPILNEGYAGIRTDFKDVQFDNFKIVNI